MTSDLDLAAQVAKRYGVVEAARRYGLSPEDIEKTVRRSGGIPAKPGELRGGELKPVVEARLVELAAYLVDDAMHWRKKLTEGVWLHHWYKDEHVQEWLDEPSPAEALKIANTVGSLVDRAIKCVREVSVIRLEDARSEEEVRVEAVEMLDELARRREGRELHPSSGNGNGAVEGTTGFSGNGSG